MSTPTLFLSVLLLICVAFPAQLYRIGVMALPTRGAMTARFQIWGLPVATLVVAGLAWSVAPLEQVAALPVDWYWLGVAVAVGLVLPPAEMAIGYLNALVRRRRVGGVALHEHWPATTVWAVVAAMIAAVAEEAVFRGIGIDLLTGAVGWPILAAVAATLVAYACNHLYFGGLTVVQKLFSGLVFGLLYVLSGASLLVPVVAHLVQNLAVLTVLPAWGRRRR